MRGSVLAQDSVNGLGRRHALPLKNLGRLLPGSNARTSWADSPHLLFTMDPDQMQFEDLVEAAEVAATK